MSVQVQVGLRARKLGVLLRDARLKERMTMAECAKIIGVKRGIWRAYEEGRRSPSLPEVEMFAYAINLPVERFWSKEVVSDDASPNEVLNLATLFGVRHRMIGALLRQRRMNASLSLKALSEQSGISTGRLRAFELGERPIPLPDLEALMAILGGQVDSLFDQTGPVGKWMTEQRAIQDFLQLPPEMREFVCKPVNHLYLELAIRLSGMSVDKLRSVAEGLLDITL
jgi:transcriptional regulator with XRE-family HTH domain